MQSKKWDMTAVQLELLQEKFIELLEDLKSTFTEKNGVANDWKFEKAHSILHMVRERILFGWSENFSNQGPEHCHIYFVKKIAHCTKNKKVFLTFLRHHVQEGHLHYLNRLADMDTEDNDEIDEAFDSQDRMEAKSARNDSPPCELGLRYPLLQSIMAGGRNHLTLQVTTKNIVYDILYMISYTIPYTVNVYHTISSCIVYYDVYYDIVCHIAYDMVYLNHDIAFDIAYEINTKDTSFVSLCLAGCRPTQSKAWKRYLHPPFKASTVCC
jgi:hypothetical protein